MKKENKIEENKTEELTNVNALESVIGTIESDIIPDNAYLVIDDKTSIVKKEYTFAIPKGKRGQVAVNNPDIIKSIEKINAAQYGQSIMGYVICKEFARLNEHVDEIVKMGFNDVADFGSTMFGYKSNTVNQYIRIGKFMIDDNYRPVQVLPSTISISAMIELLAPANDGNDGVDLAKIANWYSTGVLVDGMSKNRIRLALKEANKALPEKRSEEPQTDMPAETEEMEKDKKEEKAGNANVDAVSIIDRLNDMTPDVAAGNALNALDILSAIFEKFAADSNAAESIEELKAIARAMIK